MAITRGQGNPKWTEDETILALDLYFKCAGRIPSASDESVIALSQLLRVFPYHSKGTRKDSFRNPDGVAFKLQNLHSVATGKGLKNVSKMDRQVWSRFGGMPERTRELANLIGSGVKVIAEIEVYLDDEEVFHEGKVVTDAHKKRERHPSLRKKLLEKCRKNGALKCV